MVNIADKDITKALEEGGAKEELKVRHMHKEHLDDYCENGPKGKGKIGAIHPVLLNWAIAFLARPSVGTYNEVAKVMKLPHISYFIRRQQRWFLLAQIKGMRLILIQFGLWVSEQNVRNGQVIRRLESWLKTLAAYLLVSSTIM